MNRKRKKPPIPFTSDKCRRTNVPPFINVINYIINQLLGPEPELNKDINPEWIHKKVYIVFNHYSQLLKVQNNDVYDYNLDEIVYKSYTPVFTENLKLTWDSIYEDINNKTDLPKDFIKSIFDYQTDYLFQIGYLSLEKNNED
jgi:hypothetical protein